MSDAAVLERFLAARPLCVLTRCILGHLLTDELDEVFAQCRQRQYQGTIKFSALAASVADVALNFCANFNQAYRQHREHLAASVVAYYGKLNRVEPSIAEGVVRFASRKTAELLQALDSAPAAVLPGYRCSVLDGNHLRKTEKRLGELRGLAAAALPGTVVAKFDLQQQLFERAYLLEDAHAQESTVLDRVVADLQARELLIADRHFCITAFLLNVAAAGGCFVIRQHGRLHGALLGERRSIGRSDTGLVYEQALQIRTDDGRLLTVRRITVELDTPTRDGDRQLHLLSNVPDADASAVQLAQLYRDRWEIENAFYVVTVTLTCELKSMGHPRAALFLFCMALLAYNCRQVVYAALRTAHAAAEVEAMSQQAVAVEIGQAMDGLVTALPAGTWDRLVPASLAGRVAFLRRVSQRVRVGAYRKSRRGPKKPRPPRPGWKACKHVSTFRLLKNRKQRC
ncbi:MAG: transposase [Chloroflexi bacterium]|nr:transposase [Chloroflexota bacterium]